MSQRIQAAVEEDMPKLTRKIRKKIPITDGLGICRSCINLSTPTVLVMLWLEVFPTLKLLVLQAEIDVTRLGVHCWNASFILPHKNQKRTTGR